MSSCHTSTAVLGSRTPSHAAATALLTRLADGGGTVCISAQVYREFLAVLTRGPVEGQWKP